ncbi:MAG: 4-(cytidine 5'-diphospho)-2-C-methyl-D-erythritol kinase [Armatimonadota bacterium]|jgi:4-diphosphocytidyl-2-C-methyl-D-erythritol kinase
MESIRLLAYAKINLCLEVLGRRDDGYHDLATVFQSVMLADELQIETRDESGVSLRVPEGGAPEGPENLCWRAAEVYQRLRGWPGGMLIELHKQIPVGAGLAGGSTDAAAVLRGLAEIDTHPPAYETLERAAAALGSDVPFCLAGGTALGEGRGERLTEFSATPVYRVCLVRPDLEISTAEAYAMLTPEDFTPGSRARELAAYCATAEPLRDWAHLVSNAFAEPLQRRWPVLGELKEQLKQMGASAAEITGSGSTVFGLFDRAGLADAAAEVLVQEGYWARSVMCAARGSEPMERNGEEL